MIKIRELNFSEINNLKNFPPEDWKLDLPGFVSFHFGFEYFYSIAAEIDKKIIGFGNGILNGSTGWLGNIIVKPEYRKQGIGNKITSNLVEYFKSRGCRSQLLIASEMGKNIYSGIGFRIAGYYNVYQALKAFPGYKINKRIRAAEKDDLHGINDLDKKITGEERPEFIARFFPSALVYESEKGIDGFYLPALGGGFIAAENPGAGLELLKLRLSRNPANIVIPAENKEANLFIKNLGFQLLRNMPRMVLGEDVPWKPGSIYSRGAGYCG